MKKNLRAGVLRILDALRLPQLALVLRGDSAFIALHHGVTAEKGDGIFNYRAKFITPDAFREQIRWLKKQYSIVPLETITHAIVIGRPLPKKCVALTFDDGYENNFTNAYPILKEENVPATFFITTDFVDEKKPLPVDIVEYTIGMTKRAEIAFHLNGESRTFPLRTYDERVRADLTLRSHMKTLPKKDAEKFLELLISETGFDLRRDLMHTPYRPMSWDSIREMETGGMTFAAHTRSHPILSRCSSDEIETEIAGSAEILRAYVKNPLSVFAYPNGGKDDFNQAVITSLKKNGFTTALTTRAAPLSNREDPFRIPRYTLDGTNQMYRFRLIVSGIFDRLARLS